MKIQKELMGILREEITREIDEEIFRAMTMATRKQIIEVIFDGNKWVVQIWTPYDDPEGQIFEFPTEAEANEFMMLKKLEQ